MQNPFVFIRLFSFPWDAIADHSHHCASQFYAAKTKNELFYAASCIFMVKLKVR